VKSGQHKPYSHQAVLRVGVMGTGKSSAVDAFMDEILGLGKGVAEAMYQLVDVDLLTTASDSYRHAICSENGRKEMTGKELESAYYQARKAVNPMAIRSYLIDAAAKSGYTFSIEQTGWSFCYYKQATRSLFKAGYEVIGVSPYVPFFALKSRIIERAKREGRQPSLKNLKDNVNRLLPRVFDLAAESDKFHVVSNYVPFGEPPKLLFSYAAEFDRSLMDTQACSQRSVKREVAESLLKELNDNKDKYEEDELLVWQSEIDFLTALLNIDSECPAVKPPASDYETATGGRYEC